MGGPPARPRREPGGEGRSGEGDRCGEWVLLPRWRQVPRVRHRQGVVVVSVGRAPGWRGHRRTHASRTPAPRSLTSVVVPLSALLLALLALLALLSLLALLVLLVLLALLALLVRADRGSGGGNDLVADEDIGHGHDL